MQNNYITYYQLLGVESNASTDEILKAYKEKAKEYHPDKNDGHLTATKLFQYIQDAKDVLVDSEKRIEYDYIAGIKKRPELKPKIHAPKNNNVEALFAVGVLGLLVGVFLGSSGNGGK